MRDNTTWMCTLHDDTYRTIEQSSIEINSGDGKSYLFADMYPSLVEKIDFMVGLSVGEQHWGVRSRGFQDVLSMMRKCIVVKVGRRQNTKKNENRENL